MKPGMVNRLFTVLSCAWFGLVLLWLLVFEILSGQTMYEAFGWPILLLFYGPLAVLWTLYFVGYWIGYGEWPVNRQQLRRELVIMAPGLSWLGLTILMGLAGERWLWPVLMSTLNMDSWQLWMQYAAVYVAWIVVAFAALIIVVYIIEPKLLPMSGRNHT